MAQAQQETSSNVNTEVEQLDALVIGAGVTGIYQLYGLLQKGIKAKIFEAGSGVGGTWYWNRYPGARFDSESYSYAYSFSEELLQEWNWKEHYSGQPENEQYLNYVTDKFELRPNIRFNSRIKSVYFNDASGRWDVETEDGYRASAQFVIAAVGILSANNMPDIPGIDTFKGDSFHTSRWPKEAVDFSNKRVGVIGTGATAIQLIPEVAKQAGHLSVFQRTPQYAAPLRNSLIGDHEQQKIKDDYPETFRKCDETFGGFMHDFDPRSALEVSPEVREAFFEEIWAQPGFSKWFGCFHDIMTSNEANELYAEFVRKKIRERITDKDLAEKLVPKDYPFGAKRVPMETGYYEAYNRDNVTLIDVNESPIQSITAKGVKTADAEYELDVIIYATGFDAITGELTRMDIRGRGGESIKDKWADGPRTYMTVQTADFPNLFIPGGAVFCNFTRCAEVITEWICECIGYMKDKGHTLIETTVEAEDAWIEHANSLTDGMIFTKTDSWFMGSNIPGKKRQFLFYAAGAPAFRDKCADVASKDYEGFIFK
jgi:cation diffusion facilitator CzcD-associated flavoprotein CzcO